MATKKATKGGISEKLKKQIARANTKFKKASQASGGFTNEAVEDGTYDALLKSAEIKDLGGKAAVLFTFEIQDEEAAGEILTSRYFMESDQNLGYLKRDLAKFIDDVDEFDLAESLEDTLEEITAAGYVVKITVKSKDEYQNVYLGKVVSQGEGADDEDGEDEDEAPKKSKASKPAKGGKKAKADEDDEDEDGDEDEDSEDDEDDEDGDEEDPVEIVKGMSVLFTPPRAKKAKQFTVVKVAAGKATLEDEDGEKLTGILVDRLEVIDSDNDDEDGEDEDEAPKGKAAKGKAAAKPAKGKKSSKDEDEEDEDEEEDEDGEEAEIEVGAKVAVSYKGKEATGKVVSFDEEEGTVEVKFKAGDKTITKSFPSDKIELLA